MGPLGGEANVHYQAAISDLQRELRRPQIQKQVFSLSRAAPSELVRSKLSTTEIQHRALTYLPDELLINIPEDDNTYSLFQGFTASLPEVEPSPRRRHRQRKLLADREGTENDGTPLAGLKAERDATNHRLEMMGIRKNMCSSEIHEIDNKISNLNSMRKIVLDRLAGIETDEARLEHEREPHHMSGTNMG